MAKMTGVVTTERGTVAIAQRLAKIRQDCGITQVEMAKKLQTTQSIVSRYERGELRIHAELLLKLSKTLGVTPNEILGVHEERTIQKRQDTTTIFKSIERCSFTFETRSG